MGVEGPGTSGKSRLTGKKRHKEEMLPAPLAGTSSHLDETPVLKAAVSQSQKRWHRDGRNPGPRGCCRSLRLRTLKPLHLGTPRRVAIITVFIVQLLGLVLSSAFHQKHLGGYGRETLCKRSAATLEPPWFTHSATGYRAPPTGQDGSGHRRSRERSPLRSRGWARTQRQVWEGAEDIISGHVKR